jgi:CAF1 family ribonuclease
MQVDQTNLKAVLPLVEEKVAKALFVSIDGEFTGLWRDSNCRNTAIDSIDTRYAKSRDSAQHIGFLQFGLCTFEAAPDGSGFVASPFAFNLHPRVSAVGTDTTIAGFGGETVFSVQASSVSFLSNNHFDFNACIGKGLSFLSKEAETTLREQKKAEAVSKFKKRIMDASVAEPRIVVPDEGGSSTAPGPALAAKQAAAGADADINRSDIIRLINPKDIAWHADLIKRISEWNTAIKEKSPSLQFEGGDNEAERFPYLLLPQMSGAQRFWTYNIVEALSKAASGDGKSCSMLATVRTEDQASIPEDKQEWSKIIRITWVGEGTAGKAKWESIELTRMLAEVDTLIDEAIGFRKVIDVITRHKVPVVGHNCLLDLLHTSSKFLGPLPYNACDWARQLLDSFGTIYDTKYLASLHQCQAIPGATFPPLLRETFWHGSGLGPCYKSVAGPEAHKRVVRIPDPLPAPAPVPAPAPAPAAAPPAPIALAPTPYANGADADVVIPPLSAVSLLTKPVSAGDDAEGKTPNPAAGAATPAAASSSSAAAPAAATAPAAAPAAAPPQQRAPRTGGAGGAGGPGGDKKPEIKLMTVGMDLPSLAPVKVWLPKKLALEGAAADDTEGAGSAKRQKLSHEGPEEKMDVDESEDSISTADVQSSLVLVPDSSFDPEKHAHDAGADSYMTGVVFARMMALIGFGGYNRIKPNPAYVEFQQQQQKEQKEKQEAAAAAAATAAASSSSAEAGAAAAVAPVPAVPAPQAPPQHLLEPVPSEALTALLASLSPKEQSTTSASAGESAVDKDALSLAKACSNTLFIMTTTDAAFRSFYLSDAAELSRAGKARSSPSDLGLDDGSTGGTAIATTNRMLLSRIKADRSTLIYLSGLNGCVSNDDIVSAITTACPTIQPKAIDRRKHIHIINDHSAFVILPSTKDVVAVLEAVGVTSGTSGGSRGSGLTPTSSSAGQQQPSPLAALTSSAGAVRGWWSNLWSKLASTREATAASKAEAAAASEPPAEKRRAVAGGVDGSQPQPVPAPAGAGASSSSGGAAVVAESKDSLTAETKAILAQVESEIAGIPGALSRPKLTDFSVMSYEGYLRRFGAVYGDEVWTECLPRAAPASTSSSGAGGNRDKDKDIPLSSLVAALSK